MADKPKTANANEGDTSHDSDNTEPQYVTRDELSKLVNGAITARDKRFEAKLDDFFTRFSQTQQPAPEAKKDAQPSDDVTKRLADMEKQLAASKKEAEQAKSKHLDASLRTRVSEELGKIGISSPKHALALLVDSEKRIAWGDDEQLIWRGDDGSEVPLTEGLKSWSKGPDAKLYLAPRGTTGSGDRGVPANGNSSTQPTTKAQAGQLLMDLMSGRVDG